MLKSNMQSDIQIRDEFTRRSIHTLFCKYAIPSAICLLFVGVQTIIDGLFIGNYLGADALAGVNITIPLYTFVTSLTVVMGIGCQTVIGISSGEGNYQKASDALRTALFFLVTIASVLALLVISFSPKVVSLLGADDTLFDYSVGYITTLAPFFPVLSLLFLGDYFLKSQGRPYRGLAILGSAVLMNILFDYLFIVHLDLGVRGAALATGLSFSIGALFSIPNMLCRSNPVSVLKGRFNRSLLGGMLYNGSSEGEF